MEYRSIMDGSRRDLPAFFLRAGLSIAACGYRIGVAYRNRKFDRNPDSIQDAGVPVISVGNITAGGTGKTPLVAAIAKHLRDRELRVALVSRGYGSDETGLNDEARELYDRLPDVPHIQNPDRVEACRVAVDELDMELVILDDGFQHRRLKRDLDIVVIDATCPFGYDRLLPRGLLREPVGNLRRADFIVLSRASRITVAERDALLKRVSRLAYQAPLALCDHVPTMLIGVDSDYSLDELKQRKIVAFAGIGNPEPFFDSLPELGANLVATTSFEDHCRYDRTTVDRLAQWLAEQRQQHGEITAICTHKDMVKLRTRELANVPILALGIEVRFLEGADSFWEAIDRFSQPQHQQC